MNPRTLKIALAVSVALNLFAIAAGATLYVAQGKVEDRIEAQQRSPRSNSPKALIGQLDPAVRDRVGDALRASALAARPDFEEARTKRREAVEIAASGSFDAPRVAALLEQSRAAELRGRARLEANAVDILATLEADDRKALSEILTRRGRIVVRDRGERPDRSKDAPPAP